jgi:hypothetical protein
VPLIKKLSKQTLPSEQRLSSSSLGFADLVSSAVTQNQLVVLFGMTWLLGLLVVTVFLTQFS